jgi:type I restriction enzyme M protein
LHRFKLKSICDVVRGSNCASALQYVPELTWILFLRIFNAQEAKGRDQAEAVKALARLTPRRLSPSYSR